MPELNGSLNDAERGRGGLLRSKPVPVYFSSPERRKAVENYSKQVRPKTSMSGLLVAAVEEYMQKHPIRSSTEGTDGTAERSNRRKR